MEKSVSTALSEQEKEHEDDQEKAVPMTLVSNKEDLIALEYSQDEVSLSHGIISITTQKKEACNKTEDCLKFRKGCCKADSNRSVDQRSTNVLWNCSMLETMGSVSREESTLEKLSGLKDSVNSKEAEWRNPCNPKEFTSAMESKLITMLQVNTKDLRRETEHLHSQASPPLVGVQTVSEDERYHSSEPKHVDTFNKEHLNKSQVLEKEDFHRFGWISGHREGHGLLPKNTSKSPDVATNLSVKRQSAREASLLALPVFRKMLNPHLNKANSVECVFSPWKGQAVDSDIDEISSANPTDWALEKSGLQTAMDLVVHKHGWTVTDKDTMEHVPLKPVESPSCSTFDETRPYMCNVLLEEQEKDDVGQEGNPTVYTCIECSIYFKMKEHLMDHMLQHNRGLDQDKEDTRGLDQLTCNECGWVFGDIESLDQHRRLHQQSREKIIEEIQKLNELSDEGRDAKLQCPKCVFGTNSSKVFVRHAKMHVRERKNQGLKNVLGSSACNEPQNSSMHNVYKHFRPNEHISQVAHDAHSRSKKLSICTLCSFPAPDEKILKEHMKYAHCHLPWNIEALEADMNQPGTSRDDYSPNKSGQFLESDYSSKTDRLFPQYHCETMPHYNSYLECTAGHPKLHKTNGTSIKDIPMPGFRARKRAPYNSTQNVLAMSTLTSSKAYSPYALNQMRNKSTTLPLETERENIQSHSGGLEKQPCKWLSVNNIRTTDEEFPLTTEIELAQKRYFKSCVIPQSALELKRTFAGTLKAMDYTTLSAGQQQQLHQMVPIVLVEEINIYPKKRKKPKMKNLRKKLSPARHFAMEESLPLGVFLLDSSLEGSLELDDLLGTDSTMLKNEERKCPYCPDRFHNGIGLANHVRGHLNRVGVSYNVRHFISAEEVKAIEQKFSFQKKKKKVANFDPSTFSLMRCEFCGAGFDTRAGLSSHARAHLRDFGITNWELTISPINILKELLANSSEHPVLQYVMETDPSSPNQEREMLGFGPCKTTLPVSDYSISQSTFSPFPSSWGDESMQAFRHVMVSEEEEEMITSAMSSPLLQKKNSLAGSLDQIPNRIGTPLSPESSSNKADSQDAKFTSGDPSSEYQKKNKFQEIVKPTSNFATPNLTKCEVCGTCFETRKGLSSHARSHLRQLGVAESESSGAPIDLLYELMKQKGKMDSSPVSPSLSKKSASPKERSAGSSRPTLLLPLDKASERSQEPPVNKAIKSPPGFSPKNVSQPGSPILKKMASALPGSPPQKNPEDKSPKLPLGPLQSPPKTQWSQLEDEGPLNLTVLWVNNKPLLWSFISIIPIAVDSDSGREIDCQLCGAWFETRKGLSSHARAHLRHLGVSNPDAKGSPIDVLNDLIKNEDFKGRLSSLIHSERDSLGEIGSSDGHSPKSTATATPTTGMKQAHSPRPLGKQPSILSPHSLPPSKKLKPHGHRLSLVASLQRKQGLSSSAYWASDAEMAPLNLSSGAEPVRDIRCEFCGEYFENRKGLSSHARSHLRQMGVTEWYVNGSPIDTLREILKRRAQPRTSTSSSPAHSQKSMTQSVLGGSLEPCSPGESHMPGISKKAQQPGSPMGHSPTSSPPPTARKIFSGLPSSLHKKLKQDQLRMEIKREMISGGLHNESHLSDRAWSPRDEMSPLNLSARADPVREIRCEFCGEFFENRKGLSSHARSHLRQMGVTEWSVNGSPIDTLREIIKKKNKPCLIKKEPNTMSIELPTAMGDDDPKSPGKILQPMTLSPLGGKTGKPNLGRDMSLSLLKSQEGFLAPLSAKRPLSDERLSGHEMKHKTYIQTELPFKAKLLHEKPTHTSSEACCELCGLYFENRKALASHARAHLRQFGVTEWCVNGSPIETLSEWIKHRPQKAGAYRSYIQGGRPFAKKFRNAAHLRDGDASGKRVALSLQAGSPSLMSRSLSGEMMPNEHSKAVDGCGSSERPAITSPLSLVKVEEHHQHNINKFERRQAKPIEAPLHREDESTDLQQRAEEVRQPAPRVRPVPSLVPRPPQTSLVKFVGNIYTLKCRFCEVEFQGPLSIQEEWVRHLQRHILETNFSKADPLRSGTDMPAAPPVAEAQ
ncbi:protein Wiz isoform X3 [Ahaetulla prasina]|uniref:protein Wiz isoform X3 n=1 Tax=Ahaetulla prasina TaxID=499056 RepID=UPI0026480F9B|nr:protein Wiz isoform X3 [Ahaetulla prasina]